MANLNDYTDDMFTCIIGNTRGSQRELRPVKATVRFNIAVVNYLRMQANWKRAEQLAKRNLPLPQHLRQIYSKTNVPGWIITHHKFKFGIDNLSNGEAFPGLLKVEVNNMEAFRAATIGLTDRTNHLRLEKDLSLLLWQGMVGCRDQDLMTLGFKVEDGASSVEVIDDGR